MCITSIFHQEDFIINTNKLQYFISVYEEGSITAAAKKHYVTQVAMSQQIASLEEELGIKLFLRKKNHLCQTSAGHFFYEEIKKILKSYDNLLTDVRNYANDNKKLLRIGVNYYSLYEFIESHIRQFEAIYNDTSVIFEFYPSNELIIQLDKGFLDVIIIWDEYAKNLGFSILPAFTSHCAILVPEHHVLFSEKKIKLNQLKGSKAVMLVEELPYFKRTGQLDSLLQNIYQDTPLQKQDIIITDNVNEALLLSSEENRIIITYEDKLYKISLPNIHQHILMDSPMISQFSFVWKTTEINNALSPFLTYISKINWDSVNSIPK